MAGPVRLRNMRNFRVECVIKSKPSKICENKVIPNPNMQYIDRLLDQAVNVLPPAPAGLLWDITATSTHISIHLHIADDADEHEPMSTTHDSDSLSEADTLCVAYDTQMDFDE